MHGYSLFWHVNFILSHNRSYKLKYSVYIKQSESFCTCNSLTKLFLFSSNNFYQRTVWVRFEFLCCHESKMLFHIRKQAFLLYVIYFYVCLGNLKVLKIIGFFKLIQSWVAVNNYIYVMWNTWNKSSNCALTCTLSVKVCLFMKTVPTISQSHTSL